MSKYPIYLFLILIFAACEYPLGDITDSGVKEVKQPPYIVLDKNFTGDTIKVIKRLTTYLKFTVDSIKPLGYFLIIDNDTLVKYPYSFRNLDYKIIDGNDSYGQGLSKGVHKLRIDILAHSGSGSLADQLGLEGFIYSYLWYLEVIDTTNFINLRIDTSSNVLRIRWDKYSCPDFDSYCFLWYWGTGGNPRYESIPDINSNFMEDLTYVGVQHFYGFNVKTSEGEYYSSWIYAPWQLPEFNGITYEGGKFFLNWKDSKYQHLISDYYIYSSDGLELLISDENTRRIQVDNVGFRSGAEYWIFPVSKYDIKKIKYITHTVHDFPVYKTDLAENYGISFLNFHKLPNGNVILQQKDYKYLLFNPVERIVLKYYPYYISVISPNGKYGVEDKYENGTYYIKIYDLESDKLLYNLKSELIFGKNSGFSCVMSNALVGYFHGNGKNVAYDFKSSKILASEEHQGSTYNFEISPNGKYFLYSNSNYIRLNEIIDNSFVKKYDIQNGSYKFYGDTDDNLVYFCKDSNNSSTYNLYLINLNGGTKKRIYNGDGLIQNIDFLNSQFIVYYYNKYYFDILDFNGKKLFSFKANLSYDYGLLNESLILTDKILLHEHGQLFDMRRFY